MKKKEKQKEVVDFFFPLTAHKDAQKFLEFCKTQGYQANILSGTVIRAEVEAPENLLKRLKREGIRVQSISYLTREAKRRHSYEEK